MIRNGFNQEDVRIALKLVGRVDIDRQGIPWTHPIVVSNGQGWDSSCELLHMHDMGIRPDLIVTADVGGEHPHTWKIAEAMDEWCRSVGFPELTITSYYSPTTRYQTLEGNCLHNDGLPSLAYGGHSCSLKWKIDAIEDEIWGLEGWAPAHAALERGIRVTRCIGYDYGCADSKRFAKVDEQEQRELASGKFLHWRNRYPLREWKLSRADLPSVLKAHPEFEAMLAKHTGSPTLQKSSCFFCPAMKVHEVEKMAADYPDLALRAAVMEFRAATGKHGLTTCNGLGLGRGPKHEWDLERGTKNWSWGKHLESIGLLPSDWIEVAKREGLIPKAWDRYEVEAMGCRLAVGAARRCESEAASKLPEIYRSVLEAKGVKEEAKRKVERAVSNTAAGKKYISARRRTKKLEQAKKELVAPDWRSIPKRCPPPEIKSARRRAKKLFREAVSKAQKLCAG